MKKRFSKQPPPQPVPQQPQETVVIGVKEEEAPPRKHWITRNIVFPIKLKLSEINPQHWVTIALLLVTGYVTFIFVVTPMIKDEPITEVRFLFILGSALFAWLAAYVYHNHVGGNVCQLNLNDKQVFVDNSNVERFERSERLKVVNRMGMGIRNTDYSSSNPLRSGEQITISVPNEILMEFGSVQGMSSLHYSGASLVEIPNMTDVDYSLYYMPKRVSEERLRKDNEILSLRMILADKIVAKLERDLIKNTKTVRGPAQDSITHLIKNMSELRDVFVGSDRIHQLITNETIGGPPWRRYGYGGGFGYNNFGSEYSQPAWSKFSSPKQQQETDEEEPVE